MSLPNVLIHRVDASSPASRRLKRHVVKTPSRNVATSPRGRPATPHGRSPSNVLLLSTSREIDRCDSRRGTRRRGGQRRPLDFTFVPAERQIDAGAGRRQGISVNKGISVDRKWKISGDKGMLCWIENHASGSDLTFATPVPHAPHANVKSKGPLALISASGALDSDIRFRTSGTGVANVRMDH